jgi:hypothetical protein
VRQVPPEVRCWILTGRRSLSAWLFGEGHGEVDHEAQDHVRADHDRLPQVAVGHSRRWSSSWLTGALSSALRRRHLLPRRAASPVQ